jgi:hypothetical protein
VIPVAPVPVPLAPPVPPAAPPLPLAPPGAVTPPVPTVAPPARTPPATVLPPVPVVPPLVAKPPLPVAPPFAEPPRLGGRLSPAASGRTVAPPGPPRPLAPPLALPATPPEAPPEVVMTTPPLALSPPDPVAPPGIANPPVSAGGASLRIAEASPELEEPGPFEVQPARNRILLMYASGLVMKPPTGNVVALTLAVDTGSSWIGSVEPRAEWLRHCRAGAEDC